MMKTTKLILSFTLFFLLNGLSFSIFAQDKIHLKDGQVIEAIILEISPIEIKYKEYNNNLSPIYVVKQEYVLMYKLENPDSKVFKTNDESNTTAYVKSPIENTQIVDTKPNDMFIKGQNDAYIYYDQYKGASTSTLIVGLLSPLAGLVPAIATSSTKPKTQNLGYPNTQLFNNPDYQNGYIKAAKKIKSRKVWGNWGIAFGVNAVLYLILSSGGR